MKILAIEHETPGTPASAFTPALLADEARRVWELQQNCAIREIHFRDDRDEAVLVLECVDADEARRLLASLPLARAGLIGFELIPLRPYPGLARLFCGP